MSNSCFTDIEVACTNYEGVDAVKRALKKGLELSSEAMPIKVCNIWNLTGFTNVSYGYPVTFVQNYCTLP